MAYCDYTWRTILQFHCLCLANYSYSRRPRCILYSIHISYSSNIFWHILCFKSMVVWYTIQENILALSLCSILILILNSKYDTKIVSKVSDKIMCQNTAWLMYVLYCGIVDFIQILIVNKTSVLRWNGTKLLI